MKNQKPWTWDEIKALDADGREKLIADYGDRAVAAIMTAGHEPGTWSECILNYVCYRCPLRPYGEWGTNLYQACSNNSSTIYARMVKKLGLLPKVMK